MNPADENGADRQLRLARVAILSGVTGCFEWESDQLQDRVRGDPDLEGLEPREIKRLVAEFVKDGGKITQREETDEYWRGRRKFDYWYSVCFSVDGLRYPVFVKMVLLDDDPELPEVAIVGVHASRS